MRPYYKKVPGLNIDQDPNPLNFSQRFTHPFLNMFSQIIKWLETNKSWLWPLKTRWWDSFRRRRPRKPAKKRLILLRTPRRPQAPCKNRWITRRLWLDASKSAKKLFLKSQSTRDLWLTTLESGQRERKIWTKRRSRWVSMLQNKAHTITSSSKWTNFTGLKRHGKESRMKHSIAWKWRLSTKRTQ